MKETRNLGLDTFAPPALTQVSQDLENQKIQGMRGKASIVYDFRVT